MVYMSSKCFMSSSLVISIEFSGAVSRLYVCADHHRSKDTTVDAIDIGELKRGEGGEQEMHRISTEGKCEKYMDRREDQNHRRSVQRKMITCVVLVLAK